MKSKTCKWSDNDITPGQILDDLLAFKKTEIDLPDPKAVAALRKTVEEYRGTLEKNGA